MASENRHWWQGTKHLVSHRDSNGLCDLADKIEAVYGFGICKVMLSTVGPSAIYIDCRFPAWEKAFAYGRELLGF